MKGAEPLGGLAPTKAVLWSQHLLPDLLGRDRMHRPRTGCSGIERWCKRERGGEWGL